MKPHPELERVYTVAQVSEHFGWSADGQTLRRYIDTGFFPAGREVGNQLVWTARDIEIYIEYASRWHPRGDSEAKGKTRRKGDEKPESENEVDEK